jgi:hypothetical protein
LSRHSAATADSAFGPRLSALDFSCGSAALYSPIQILLPSLYSAAHQPLAIHPSSDPSKPPQKVPLSAAKTPFAPNYFCNRLPTFPTPTATSPLFYRVFVVVLPLNSAMKIVPTVGRTNSETML